MMRDQISSEAVKTVDERLFEIACTFPVLKFLGVTKGKIPGITPTCFHDKQLSEFLYDQEGQYLSEGESLVLEYLLNLYNPYHYQQFNLGRALMVWDSGQLGAFVKALKVIKQNPC